MPKLVNSLPSYRRHKASGQAVVTLNGKDHYLGPHGSKVSRDEYDRLIAEWLAVFSLLLSLLSIPSVFVAMRGLIIAIPDAAESYSLSEAVQLVIQNTYETGRMLLQAAITLIAVSWGFVEIRDANQDVLLKSPGSRFIFICGTWCLAWSAKAYVNLADVLGYYLQLSELTPFVLRIGCRVGRLCNL